MKQRWGEFLCRVFGHDDYIAAFHHSERGWSGKTVECARCHRRFTEDADLGNERLPKGWAT